LIDGKFWIVKPHGNKQNNAKHRRQGDASANNEKGSRDQNRATQESEGREKMNDITLKKLVLDLDRISRWMSSQVNNLQRQIDDLHAVINKPLNADSVEFKQESSSSLIQ
jgi:hypothetical protein